MSATKRFLNVTGAKFTPKNPDGTDGTPVVFTGVTSASCDPGGSLVKFSGDADRYQTTVVNDFNEPSVTFQSADVGAIGSVATGQEGKVEYKIPDAKNGTAAGGGGLLVTLNPCVVDKRPIQGAHRQYGHGTVSFTGFSADGQTNPLTVTNL